MLGGLIVDMVLALLCWDREGSVQVGACGEADCMSLCLSPVCKVWKPYTA